MVSWLNIVFLVIGSNFSLFIAGGIVHYRDVTECQPIRQTPTKGIREPPTLIIDDQLPVLEIYAPSRYTGAFRLSNTHFVFENQRAGAL